MIIESNEKGKLAQVLVVELDKKIFVLESLIEQSKERIANLLSIVNDKDLQVKAMKKIQENDSIVIANKEAIITDLNTDKKILTKQLKRQKFKTVLTGIIGIAGIVTVTYLSIN